ncbi:MAG: DUF305 domain-containing protein [Blastocatellia bacterium]|nr:DUF305 domain-containing protein [Blastocatellia bacterium]
MKTIILTIVLSLAAVIFAACGQTATNNSMNRNSMMMNSNSPMNMNGMNHNSMTMNSNMPMDHSDMKSDANAASQPYDLQFLDTMTAHHTGAVEMAKLVDGRTQNADMKKFAADIIRDQEKEIAQMTGWREKWFAGKPPAMNMEMPGMADSMKMDMPKLTSSKNKEFDLAFIDMMTPHHAGAVTMAKEALTKAEHPEIKSLANQIIKAQETEMKMMADWKTKWSK